MLLISLPRSSFLVKEAYDVLLLGLRLMFGNIPDPEPIG